MSRKFIRVIIPILIVVEFSFIFLTFMSYQNKDVTSIKETTKIDKKRFAMYVENIEGEYEEVEDVPFEGRHLLNLEKTTCVDNKGNELTNVISYKDDKVTVTSNKTLFCYLYFDMKIDIKINVTTDGEAGKVPTTLGYTKSITCEDGTTPTWNYKYNRLEFTGIGSAESKCDLTYSKDTNTYETLVNVVQKDDEVQYASYNEPDYTTGVSLTETEYLNVDTYYSTSSRSTSGTAISNAFTYLDGAWNNVHDNLVSGNYYHFKFMPAEDGYYQVCYTMGLGSDDLLVYKNSTQKGSKIEAGSTEKTGCVEVGYVDSEDSIRIVDYAISDSTNGFSEVSFYVQKVEYTDYSAGYRYWGTNPDNYLWFNNEMWRIIGSIPTRVSEDGTTESLVKIIRKDSIGSLASNKGLWGVDQHLYNLLNSYYFGKKDGTESGYCYSNTSNNTQKGKCDYSVVGISSNSAYGKMIKEVYWGNGYLNNRNTTTARNIYYNVENTSFSLGYIGLMAISDYGFATNNRYYDTNVGLYNTLDISSSNWLYSQSDEWTNNFSSTLFSGWYITNAKINSDSTTQSRHIRPVVYLDSSVYVIAGSGTETDPYQVAMK